jgi:adenylate cyclase
MQPQSLTLTIGFSDLSHFTRALSELGVDRSLELLQRMYETAGDEIASAGGTLRKYMGDAIMFTFTDPAKAVEAAHAIASGFEHREAGLVLLPHVGVATGRVVMAEIGHSSLRLVDVFGPAVNTAARLIKEAYKAKDRVALCEETRKLTGRS